MSTEPHALAPHTPVFDVPVAFAASKATSYRRRVLARAAAIAAVFTDEQLAAVDLRARYADDSSSFKVVLSELTLEGLAFYSKRYFAWLKKTDRATADRSPEALEALLRKEVAAHRRQRT